MAKTFKVGDHVTWNSEAGRVSGHIVRVHTREVKYKGHICHATTDEPQYEIKSDKTDHVAMHKGVAATARLTRVSVQHHPSSSPGPRSTDLTFQLLSMRQPHRLG